MTERYFKREWEEEYYIFDSTKISEEKVDEEIEYGYEIFADALTGDEVINKLNELENFITNMANRCGKIVLSNGNCYNIRKVIDYD